MWKLEMTDETGTLEVVSFDEEPTDDYIQSSIEDWVSGGDWGPEGASVRVNWTLTGGPWVSEGMYTVVVPPDHEELIRSAVRGHRHCGLSPSDHDWTAEGEGGVAENPGVWSVGGTKLCFSTRCRLCGLRRVEVTLGSQRNLGELDTVKYEMPG